MRYSTSNAFRRADCCLAGAIFLTFATMAAIAVYNPVAPANGVMRPKFLDAVMRPKIFDIPQPIATIEIPPPSPEVVPVPRPAFARLHIEVALANFATEATCLAEAMYYEARGEGVTGEKAIAEVVVHRTRRAGYPHSICGVVHQGVGDACQFSFVCNGTMDEPRAPSEWARAMRLATRILTGVAPLTDITDGAIAFHAAGVQPDWPGFVRTVQIGNHIFYRRPARSHAI